MKTLAIRLEDGLHARLSLLSKLSETSVTDTIRAAIEQYLAQLTADTAIAAKASQLTAEIDKQADQQRQALAEMFGNTPGNAKPATRSHGPAKG